MLIERSANVNAVDEENESALIHATVNGNNSNQCQHVFKNRFESGLLTPTTS